MLNNIKYSVMLLALLGMQGCGSSSSSDTAPTDVTTLFEDLADQIILPNYRNSKTAISALAGASGTIQNYCDAIGTATELTQRTVAQSAWRSAMAIWQQTELHKFGPVLDNNQGLQNRISSYEQGKTNTCAIDQSVVQAQSAGFNLSVKTTTQKGMGAIEYLLFNDDLTHTCPGSITETTDWNARTEQQRKEWRCEYAGIIAADAANAVSDVVSKWEIDGDNYRGVFINDQNNASSFQDVSDALFYMDGVAKDKKLGVPTGISANCSQFSCPEEAESRFSETSLVNLKANLESFKLLLTGNGGLGLGSLVADAGVPEVTERLLQYSNDAITAIDDMNVSLFDQVTSIDTDPEQTECTNAYNSPDTASNFPVCNLYGHVKRISDELKTGFVTATNSSIPVSSQSDND